MDTSRIIYNINQYLEKQQKVYLRPGQPAPEGSEIKVGRRGGKYYIDAGKVVPSKEKDIKTITKYPLIKQIYRSISKLPESEQTKAIKQKIMQSKGKPVAFSPGEYKVVLYALWNDVYLTARDKMKNLLGRK